MRRLIDLNRGAVFEDTRGVVGSAPYKLGDQRKQVISEQGGLIQGRKQVNCEQEREQVNRGANR